MYWPNVPLIVPYLFAGLVSLLLARYIWRRRPAPGAAALAVAMLLVADWSIFAGFALAGATLPLQLLGDKLANPGVAGVSGAFLAFVFGYTGRAHWINRYTLVLLALEPLATVAIVWSSEWNHLWWDELYLQPYGPFLFHAATRGWWYWANAVYAEAMLLAATVMLLASVVRARGLYQGQALVVASAVSVPWVAAMLRLLQAGGRIRFPPLDPVPLGFAASGAILAWGLYRFRLLDVMPVAHRAVMMGLVDGVLVLDAQNRVVELNPAAEQILGRRAAEVIGRPAHDVFTGTPDRVERYLKEEYAHAEIALPVRGATAGAGTDRAHHYDLRISPVRDGRNRLTARTIVLRDVSERRRAELLERELRQAELTHAWEIQRRLLPTSLAHWPGKLELAVRFRPARETSGDFYDVVALESGGAAAAGSLPPLHIMVGDVAGKGIAAALVMAVARTTLRAVAQPAALVAEAAAQPASVAAAPAAYGVSGSPRAARAAAPRQERSNGHARDASGAPVTGSAAVISPAAVARQASRLLHRDTGRKDFVACVLAVLEATGRRDAVRAGARTAAADKDEEEPTRSEIRLRLTNAAQVPPLLCRGGQARELQAAGERLPLGVLDTPDYRDLTMDLYAGDAIVFASDGLPEAPNAHGELFGFSRLAESATAAWGGDAEAVAGRMWSDVTAWSGPEPGHDDMTLLVVRVL